MSGDPLKDHIAEISSAMKATQGRGERDLLGHILQRLGADVHEMEHAERREFADQVDEAALKFELNHPKLAGTLRELGDSLNKMGL